MATFAVASNEKFNFMDLDAQIQLIDIEILLLRAELAQKNSQARVVSRYLRQLKNKQLKDMNPPDSFLTRIEALKLYLELAPSVMVKDIPFTFDAENIVVILPLTGVYAKAGNDVLKGISSKMQEKSFKVIDSAIYDNAFELWELVRLYRPSFIFGPLRKELVQGLVDLNIEVPALMFNESQVKKPHIKHLSPNRLDDVDVLMKQVLAQNYRSVLVISSPDKRSQQLVNHFNQAWLKLAEEKQFNLIEEQINKSIDEVISLSIGAKKSKGRANWLQRTIGKPLTTRERSRQDINVVISFVPYRYAMQISPILAYYNLRQVSHIWLPASLPKEKIFYQTLPFWQDTQAILPFYQAQSLNRQQGVSVEEAGVGIFFALGEAGVQVIRKTTGLGVNQVLTDLGKIEVTLEGTLRIKPGFYWLDSNEMIQMRAH